MPESCPECGHQFAGEDSPCEVYAEVRDGGAHGLRIDVAFVCDGCETNIVIEDAAADTGAIGQVTSAGFLSRFDGQGYRA